MTAPPVLAWSLFLSLTVGLLPGVVVRAEEPCGKKKSAEPVGTPHAYRMLNEDGVAKFPFEIFHGDIRFRGRINGHDVHLLLDDGFLWDELLFWGSPGVDALGLEYDGEISVKGSKDGKGIASKTASGITLTLPGIEFPGERAIVTPYSSGVSGLWSGSEGQVSGTFFKNLIVAIDFDEMTITLTEPDRFEYIGKGVEIPWKPTGRGTRAIPATLRFADGSSASLDLAMDLGYNDQLLINTRRKHGIVAPSRSLPTSLGLNIEGEETLGRFGRISRVEIGGHPVEDVLAAFIPEEQWNGTFDEAMVGLGLLSRFNLVFDYTGQRLYVEPNDSVSRPFEFDMSGLSMRRGTGEFLEVRRVLPDSPASEAGLRVGDRVTRINGDPAIEYDLWKLRRLMRQEGAAVRLAVSRGGKEREVSFTLRRLI